MSDPSLSDIDFKNKMTGETDYPYLFTKTKEYDTTVKYQFEN